MIQSLFILHSHTGDVILEKHWRGQTTRALVDVFWEEVSKRPKRDDVPPVIPSSKYYLVSILRGEVFVLATVTGEVPSLYVLEFLHRVVDNLELYFEEVSPRTLTTNFSIVYQLLEEMLDSGFPLITEPNSLVTLIAPPSIGSRLVSFIAGKSGVSETLGAGATSIIPWRRADVSYAQNEIFFDVIEEIDCIVESNGVVVKNDVRGVMMCNSHMSGTPDLTLVLNDPTILEEASFHPCVRLARFERDRVLSFVPPDGPFKLMDYKAADRGHLSPLSVRPSVAYRDGAARVSFTVAARPMAVRRVTATGGAGSVAASDLPPVEDIVVTVFFPTAIKSVDMGAEHGAILFDAATNTITWTIGRMPADGSPTLAGSVALAPGAPVPLEPIHATVRFMIGGTSVSGLSVRDLHLHGETYKYFKGARSMLRTGRFQIRT